MKPKLIGVLVAVALLAAFAVFGTWMSGRPSALPDFDAAEFRGLGSEAGMHPVKFSGAEVAELRRIFEGVPADPNPAKWQVFGNLELLKDGREVLNIGVFSKSSGPGPFRFSQDRYFLGYDQEAFRALLAAGGGSSDPAR